MTIAKTHLVCEKGSRVVRLQLVRQACWGNVCCSRWTERRQSQRQHSGCRDTTPVITHTQDTEIHKRTDHAPQTITLQIPRTRGEYTDFVSWSTLSCWHFVVMTMTLRLGQLVSTSSCHCLVRWLGAITRLARHSISEPSSTATHTHKHTHNKAYKQTYMKAYTQTTPATLSPSDKMARHWPASPEAQLDTQTHTQWGIQTDIHEGTHVTLSQAKKWLGTDRQALKHS